MVVVTQPGYRTKGFFIVTTLLDPIKYPSEKIAELYLRRWNVELFFRDIKTTMGLDILRCQIPEMISKEIIMNFIAYNCVRRLRDEAAERSDVAVRMVGFKRSLQAIRNWQPQLNHDKLSNTERIKMLDDLYGTVTGLPLQQRPGRREPRCQNDARKTTSY